MNNLIQRIRQKWCRHIDEPQNRNSQMPFVGYEFQCPKCKAYVAYFQNSNDYIILSELQHNIAVEEGKKYWLIEQKYKDFGKL